MNCEFCKKFLKTPAALSTHVRFCKLNPQKSTSHKSGGYREGSGRAKTGYYRGVYCGSTYELCWVIYQIDHRLDFKRFEGCLESEHLKYFPDFIQDGKIIEIKGFEDIEKVNAKIALANSLGYDVKVLRKENLQEEFRWVKDNYHFNELSELYDSYSPKYEYTCSLCLATFKSDKKKQSKTGLVFCSRTCAGKGSVGNKGKKLSDFHKRKISNSLKRNTPVV